MLTKRSHGRKRPSVYIIAGPNGAGKTTFATRFLPQIADCSNFINADLIARGLSPFDVDMAALQAGRIFLKNINYHMEHKSDFGFETTLSGIGYVRLLEQLRKKGYYINLYFLWIPTVSLALKRIAERVRHGGHIVPPDIVRRRYLKGIRNLFEIYMHLTDYCAIFDNCSTEPVLVFERMNTIKKIILPETFINILRQSEVKK